MDRTRTGQTADLGRLVLAVGLTAVLAGCGGEPQKGPKLTADEAARALAQRASVPVQVRCAPDEASFAGWDYTCTYLDEGHTVGINVDGTGITEYSG